MKYDILISGVGGQGTILASRLLALSAMEAGFFARTAETIGMSQRGGSVVSHVRIDSKDLSSVIPLSCADLLIGFELSEAARCLQRLSPQGKCIINTQVIKPVTASLGNSKYDSDEIMEFIQKTCPSAIFIDGYSLAEQAGSIKAVNIVLLGAASAQGFLPFDRAVLEKVIASNVPQKYVELNMKAFELGYRQNIRYR
jgi:indolepyruvate ferredoxin oxidoreductase beta subunit